MILELIRGVHDPTLWQTMLRQSKEATLSDLVKIARTWKTKGDQRVKNSNLDQHQSSIWGIKTSDHPNAKGQVLFGRFRHPITTNARGRFAKTVEREARGKGNARHQTRSAMNATYEATLAKTGHNNKNATKNRCPPEIKGKKRHLRP